MKFLVNLLVIAGAGFLGYAFEPNLRLELTGISHVPPQPKAEAGNQQEQILAKVNLMGYDPSQLPKEVTLKKPAEVTDSSSGLKLTIPAGSKVKMVRLETGLVIVSPGAPTMEGAVEVQDTDIREQLISNPPAAIDPNAVAAAPAEKPPAMDAMGQNGPADDAPPAAEKPAEGDPSMAEATGGANAALAPEKGSEPAAPAEFSAISQDEIVKIMQDSIRSGQVTSFKFEDVAEWAAAEPEEVNGAKFNVGMITYTGTTFMGKSQLKGKAFIAGGKVHNWINPKSGTDLK